LTQFFANLLGSSVEPVAWARQREAEGWDGVGVTDHLWAGTTAFSHWAVGQLAAVTERVTLLSCFANNLLRSPVEFAQAALALQRASGGRFEAGLGAGWSREEIEGIGACFPGPAGRAERYAEAVRVVRELFETGQCSFAGAHYRIEVPVIGPTVERAPPIVVSVGGPRTIREVAPLADRVEIAFNAAATRGGDQGVPRMAELGRAHLDDLVERVARSAPDAPRGIFLTIACGDDDIVRRLDRSGALGIRGLAGPPGLVAATVLELADDRIDRVQLTPATPSTLSLIAQHLPLAHRP
jgi:alkanesulfonate monooxygenase SsuD/methylene tetrahydromethanopterin reductase-like flavin-dependent oxidoreductase (luciferase family)